MAPAPQLTCCFPAPLHLALAIHAAPLPYSLSCPSSDATPLVEPCFSLHGVHQVLFPASLTPRQRALLHGVAEAEGLPHASEGTDANRRIAIGSGQLVR